MAAAKKQAAATSTAPDKKPVQTEAPKASAKKQVVTQRPDHVLQPGDSGYVDHVLEPGEPGYVDHIPDDQA